MKKKLIIGIGIFSLVLVMIIFNVVKASKTEGGFSVGGKKAYDVEVQTLELKPIESTIIVSGNVEEQNKQELIMPTQTTVEKWLVQKGDPVKKGDQILQVDTSGLEQELSQQYISKDQQVLELNRVKQLYNNKNGTGSQYNLEVARLNVESARSNLEKQQKQHDNNKVLFSEGIISQNELDASAQLLSDAEQQLKVAELNFTKSGTDNKIDLEVQQKRLEAINLNIKDLEQKLSKLKAATISPIDGILTEVFVEEGNLANGMQSIGEIVDTKALKVVANIREYDFKKIALGQKAKLTGDAIKEDAVVTAEVQYIAPTAKKTLNGTKEEIAIPVELTITDGLEYLKPGFTVDCEISSESKESAIVASYDMFKEDKDGSKYVFIVGENNLLKKQPVKLGIVSDFNAEIIEGLKVGDKVVINPSLVLKEGSKVKANEIEE